MKRVRLILTGWYFWIMNYHAPLAQERLKICNICKYRKGMICSDCGCILQAKARLIEDDCPKGFWPNHKNTMYIDR